MAENDDKGGPIAEDPRLDSLDQRLAKAQEIEAERTGSNRKGQDENYRLGNRVLAELLGGMIGGAAIGWTIDHFAGTSPWGLLVMLFLGIGVAFRNIIRISNRQSRTDGRQE
jgi:ATP synthase protein I